MDLNWIVYNCILPTLRQGVIFSFPLLVTGFLIRLLVRIWKTPSHLVVNAFASVMGLLVLWWYYRESVIYFVVLCGIVYGELIFLHQHRGLAVGITSVIFLFTCEGLIASPTDWHRIRGSFLVMVMKMVSLGFDVESRTSRQGDKRPPSVPNVPNIVAYTGYCIFPSTTIFGPFLTFNDHKIFLSPSPLSLTWIISVVQAWLVAMVCLCISVCVMPFAFNEPHWNRWLAAYTAAASFRYSHYFVSFLSQCGTYVAGIGHEIREPHSWSRFHVVHPLSIELPRSLGMVVINWNIPMHHFLKDYVFKPSLSYVGRFGAILFTYFASAILHGLNFQLAAVLLSIGIYAYIESVLRSKLSQRFDACILDKPCTADCKHRKKRGSGTVLFVNLLFSMLALFHLAYLGVMFGAQSEVDDSLQYKGYSLYHTLRKWAHLDFLSHWVTLLTYIIFLLL